MTVLIQIMKYMAMLTLSTSVVFAGSPKSGLCSPKCAHHQQAHTTLVKEPKPDAEPQAKAGKGGLHCHEKNSSGPAIDDDDATSERDLERDLIRSANCSCDHARFVKTVSFLIQKKQSFEQSYFLEIQLHTSPFIDNLYSGFSPELEPPPPRV